MSLVNDLKKLLFGAKAITKSAADNAVQAGREAGEEILEKGAELLDTTREKVAEVSGKVAESAGDFLEKAMQTAETVGETVSRKTDEIWDSLMADKPASTPGNPSQQNFSSTAGASADPNLLPPDPPASKVEELGKTVLDTAEKVGAQVIEHGGEALDKVLHVAEKVGEKVLQVSEGAGEKIMHTAEDIGGKILEKGGETLERAKDLGQQFWVKASDLMQKAQEEAAKEDMEATLHQAEEMERKAAQQANAATGGSKDSLLDKHESFFERASRFADGDYRAAPVIGKDPDFVSGAKTGGTAAGFTDLDGDGNEIIDDAILDDGDKS